LGADGWRTEDVMDPSYFIGNILGAFLAAMPPGQCDYRGVCPPRIIVVPGGAGYARQQPPSRLEQDALGVQVKQEILAFCQAHPEEHFCGT
jgi:hypothetical protein